MKEDAPRSTLKASNVFLDAAVFIEANFDYESPRFQALARLATEGRVHVLLTEITLREIKTNLTSLIERPLKRPSPILRNSQAPEVKVLFQPLNVESIKLELLDQLKDFLEHARVTVLPLGEDALSAILDDYFARRLPFDAGKNKAEFPDALALHALEGWCKRKDASVAVITRDAGVKRACSERKSLHHFEDLAQYLDAVASEDEELAGFIRSEMPKHLKTVFEHAKADFPSFGATLADQDGDVEEIELVDIEYYDEIDIISLTATGAVVEIPATITFTAELSYYEPGTGVYDREDGVVLFQDIVNEKVTRTEEESVSVKLKYEELDPDSFKVERAWFEGGDLYIESDFEKDWPYK